MKLDYQKELTPVLYGDSAVKVIKHNFIKPDGLGFSMHWHDRMEILFVHSGSLSVSLGEQTVSVKAGQVAIFPPCIPHSGRGQKAGANYDVIMFDISKFYNTTGASERFLVPLHEQNTAFTPVTEQKDIVASVKEILSLYDNSDGISDIIAVGEVYRLIGLLFKHCVDSEHPVPQDSGRFKEVLDFVNKSFCENISSASLSRKFGYDETYFCRKFKSVTGLSPMIYIRILRLEKAKKLIKQSNIMLTDVATACAFSELGYFSRCFKKHFGIAPKEYSMKYRK